MRKTGTNYIKGILIKINFFLICNGFKKFPTLFPRNVKNKNFYKNFRKKMNFQVQAKGQKRSRNFTLQKKCLGRFSHRKCTINAF